MQVFDPITARKAGDRTTTVTTVDLSPDPFRKNAQEHLPAGANMLPTDIRGGVHYDLLAPDTVTFVLYAPFKPYVSLVGDFNQWNSRANRMVTDGRGVWWTTIRHPGATRYGYYIAIDDQSHAWVGDPYATQVEWTVRAPWGSLPEKAVSFPWTDHDWKTPPLRDLIIYELCVRDFAGYWETTKPHLGNFRDLLTYVDYLAELGINAVELMPIQAFPGDSSWGYNPVFYFALANAYGAPEDCKAFVDACHSRGIAVILDVAFNHAFGQHPYYQFYPPMYGPKGEELADWNPFFHHTPRAINSWGGVDWDHFAPETTRYFQDVIRFWFAEYHIDGFRFDWVGGVDYDSQQPMNPAFNPYHGISALCWAARTAKSDCILIGEYWQLDGTNPAKTAAKLVHETAMDACWNGDFHHVLEDVLNQRWEWEKRDIFRALGGFRDLGYTSATQVVNYSCSHDEVRPEHEIIFYAQQHIARPAGMSVRELAQRKAFLGLVALIAAPGIPMLYAGQEFGEDTPRTIDFLPLHWEKLKQPIYSAYYQRVLRLLHVRRTHPALRSDHIHFYVNDFATDQLVRFDRFVYDASGQRMTDFAAVALNFGETAHSVTLNVPWSGRWQEVVSGQIFTLKTGTWRGSVEAWQCLLLIPVR
ncbi:MAG: alpha-amylase family glycosyl hydrolase [Caldilineaceae bacterium]